MPANYRFQLIAWEPHRKRSAVSCLEEAGGPDSIYVNPDDITGLADAFKQIYSNSDKRKNMVEKGREFAKRFSEKQQSEEIINIYKKLIR